ncbi:Daple [Actinoplanes sp. NPDC051346]|uniref:Daple n=1 Tax=Actinoplanes sp. NPDC051346 TaxID=3155048 RepID=UPI003445D214
MDETGHSGDAGTADGGSGAESRDRTLLNGWATRDSPWSNAGAALDPEAEIPAWRRPGAQDRAFNPRPLPTDPPEGDIRPFAAQPPPSFTPAQPSSAQPSSAPPSASQPAADSPRAENGTPRWSDSRARYQDLVSHLSPNGTEPRQGPSPRQNQPPRAADPHARPDPLSPELLRSNGHDVADPRGGQPSVPASAPPYPYEGDLDARPVFPAAPVGHRADREAARHALDPRPAEGPTRSEQDPDEGARTGDQGTARASYDPSSFPRRLPYQSPQSAYPARPAGDPGGAGAASHSALPQRVPAQPDVPTVPEPPSVEPSAETPALARIATHLRRGDVLSARERQDGFDVNAILEAVREVGGVRDAALRTTPAGAHSLRLDLAEGADPAEVSRQVARLLQDRMGLDAAMQGASPFGGSPVPAQGPPASAPRSAPPSRPGQPASPSAPIAGPSTVIGPPAPSTGQPLPPAQDPRSTPERDSPPFVSGQASAPPAAQPVPFVPTQPNPAGRSAPPTSAPPASAPPPPELAPSAPASVEPVSTGPETAVPRPLLDPGERPGPRVMIEQVQVSTFGTEATVSVRLTVDGQTAAGEATGPGIDGYLLRLCAMATAKAVDELLAHSDHAEGPAKCFVEHAAAVPFGATQVAVVVVLLATDGWVEQLAGSAVVAGDDRHAMVRATLAAVNRRLEALLS